MKIRTINDVAEWQLCTGCGICASMQPAVLEMIDVARYGRRPALRPGHSSAETAVALAVCPGVGLTQGPPPAGSDAGVFDGWGPVLTLWEGHASDPEIRFLGSSGGTISALAVAAVEEQGMAGVLHITARPDAPILNHTVLSRTRAEIVAAAGSRYAPASPCDRLDLLNEVDGPCVVIGKPCDIAAIHRLAAQDPDWAAKIGLTIALFCAGTPSLNGTFAMLRAMGVTDPTQVREIAYRGRGWPGRARVVFQQGDRLETRELSYEESWGDILQEHRQWRCYICADHSGEFADVAVGDPWYRPIEEGNAGLSLVVARTDRGKRAVEAAIASGALVMSEVGSDKLAASQPGFVENRGAIWGRLAVLRLVGAPRPRFRNMPTFRFWWRLPLGQRAQSLYGTLKRLFVKRLLRRARLERFSPPTFEG